MHHHATIFFGNKQILSFNWLGEFPNPFKKKDGAQTYAEAQKTYTHDIKKIMSLTLNFWSLLMWLHRFYSVEVAAFHG